MTWPPRRPFPVLLLLRGPGSPRAGPKATGPCAGIVEGRGPMSGSVGLVALRAPRCPGKQGRGGGGPWGVSVVDTDSGGFPGPLAAWSGSGTRPLGGRGPPRGGAGDVGRQGSWGLAPEVMQEDEEQWVCPATGCSRDQRGESPRAGQRFSFHRDSQGHARLRQAQALLCSYGAPGRRGSGLSGTSAPPCAGRPPRAGGAAAHEPPGLMLGAWAPGPHPLVPHPLPPGAHAPPQALSPWPSCPSPLDPHCPPSAPAPCPLAPSPHAGSLVPRPSPAPHGPRPRPPILIPKPPHWVLPPGTQKGLRPLQGQLVSQVETVPGPSSPRS